MRTVPSCKLSSLKRFKNILFRDRSARLLAKFGLFRIKPEIACNAPQPVGVYKVRVYSACTPAAHLMSAFLRAKHAPLCTCMCAL
jgi:hypothetical protein